MAAGVTDSEAGAVVQPAQSQERMAALVEHSSDVLLLVNNEGLVEYISPSVEKVTGFTPAEMTGRRALDQIHPDDIEGLRAAYERVLVNREQSPLQVEIRLRHKRGDYIWVQVQLSDLRDQPAVNAVVVNYRDITHQRALHEQLLQSQRMEAIGRLAGGIAHDFNNMLTAIRGFASVLHESLPRASHLRSDAAQILAASDRAASMTNRLLAFSRRQEMQVETLDLNELVDEVEPMLRRLIGEQVVLHMGLSQAPCPVRADPVQLHQVLLNLVVNSREALTNGGNVTVQTGKVALLHPEMHWDGEAAPGSYVVLTVSDDGEGMDPSVQEHVFEPFYTTKPGGTGLGLATVYGIVRQSGGFIALDSKAGEGTSFRIHLPASVEPAARKAPSAAENTNAGRGTILLAEDEESVRRLVERVLAARGYTVIVAPDGFEAWEEAKEAGHLDLLITDVVMPGRDGLELAKMLRSTDPDLPVLFVSGYAKSAVMDEMQGATRSAFLPKPFKTDMLLDLVQQLMSDPDSMGLAG